MNPALHLVPPACAPAPGTLDWVAAKYLRHLQQRVAVGNFKRKSEKRSIAYLGKFLSFIYADDDSDPVRLGGLSLYDARQKHLKAWLIANYERWQKGSTRADALGVVLACFNWWGDGEEEPPIFIRPKKLQFHRSHYRAMRKHHYRAIMRAARQAHGQAETLAFRWALFFAWHTGSRLIEMRHLEFSHIDWEAGMVRDLPSKTDHQTGQLRSFALGPRLLAVLRGLHARRRPGQRLVFLTRRRRAWTKDNLGRRFAHYRELAGVPESIKAAGTRHGYAVRLMLVGESPKVVADQLGHSGTRMIEQIYGRETRYDAEHLRGLASRAEKRTRPKPAPPTTPWKRPAEPCPLFDQAAQAEPK